MFVQTPIIAIAREIIPPWEGYGYWSLMQELGMMLWLIPLLGVLFLVGSFFARTGLGVTAVTERRVGGHIERGVETANGLTCGCMTGIAVIGISFTFCMRFMADTGGLVIVGVLPALLGGLAAIAAGVVSLKATIDQGRIAQVQEAHPVRFDSVSCSYCGKTGISPQAQSCPSCGQPLG